MQVTETLQDGLKREFKVVIEAKELAEKVDHRLEEIAGQANLPGFRPGKVPEKVIRQRYGSAVLGEIVEKAVNDSANQAMSERNMRPAVEPKIEVTDFAEGSDLEYKLAVEILPDIEPMDFSKLSLTKVTTTPPDSDVEDAMKEVASQQKESKPLDKPRKSKDGDVVVVDFTGRLDGKEFPGGQADDYHLGLGSGQFIPGFEEQLIGQDAGADVTVKVTFPADYGNDELKGKDAEFAVKIKEIREQVPVTISEEFAKNNGFESLDAMRNAVRDTLQQNYEQVTMGRLKRQLLDALSDGHDFAAPEGMIDLEFDSIWQQIEEAKERNELEEEDKAKSEDELKAEYREIAERRVRLGLLLSEVGHRASIDVTDQEVNQAIMAEAQRFPGREREVFEIYQKNPAAKANLRAPIYENKVVEYILELAQVEEKSVTPEELLKADEDDEAAAAPAKKSAAKKKAPAKKKAAAKTAKDES